MLNRDLCGGTNGDVFLMSVKFIYLISILALGGSSAAFAQTLRNSEGPAEVPAANFTGNQYVDSNGCMFIRAGYGGDIVWVPRVGRDRNLLCGFVPTVVGSDTATVESRSPAISTTTVADTTELAASSTLVTTIRPSTSVSIPVTQRASTALVPMRSGFRAAWSDGRLNQSRGPLTATGDAQMALVWTNTVPRKLVALTN